MTLELTPAAVDWIAEHGYQPEFGARPMRRVIQREVDNQLSRLLLDGRISPGQAVSVDVAGRPADLHPARPAGPRPGWLTWTFKIKFKVKIKGTQRKARHGTRKLQARARA